VVQYGRPSTDTRGFLGAVVIVPEVSLDGLVLVVGALLAASAGFLAYTVNVERRRS
jgi:hypothetical protein